MGGPVVFQRGFSRRAEGVQVGEGKVGKDGVGLQMRGGIGEGNQVGEGAVDGGRGVGGWGGRGIQPQLGGGCVGRIDGIATGVGRMVVRSGGEMGMGRGMERAR